MTDLNARHDLNTLTLESRREIWIPQVVFYNTEVKTESLNDRKAFASVRRSGSYQRRNSSYLHNARLFKGGENAITLSRVYSSKFICEYDMAVYPFDSQRCSAIFILKGNAGNLLRLSAADTAYLGPIDLPQYFVMDTTIAEIVVPPDVGAVKVEIVFGRRILSTMLSSYLPTFLICLMSFSTNYFKPFFFEAVVTVNLTSLLALTTLFISVSNSLPKTAYIKMMDVWLIFCLTIPFSEVVLQVSLHFLTYRMFSKYFLPKFKTKVPHTVQRTLLLYIVICMPQTYLEYLRESQTVNHHGSTRHVDGGPPRPVEKKNFTRGKRSTNIGINNK